MVTINDGRFNNVHSNNYGCSTVVLYPPSMNTFCTADGLARVVLNTRQLSISLAIFLTSTSDTTFVVRSSVTDNNTKLE